MAIRTPVTRTLVVLLSGALGALWGCQSTKPAPTAQSAPAAAPAQAERTVAPPPGSSTAKDLEPDIRSQDIRSLNEKGYLKPVFFDYDRAELRDDARSTLTTDADWLKKYGAFQFVIEGHCDERGTEAYNLALGERRAAAAREYLAALGVDANRMKIVSYGKERPFCSDQSDPCFQSNRRDHLLITAK